MFIKLFILLTAISFSLLLPPAANSDEVRLHIPVLEDSPKLHLYFHELLETALKEAGHVPVLISRKMPQLRIKKSLESGEISIYWMLESTERNAEYIPIEVGLTNEIIGKRILFIKKGDQHLYDNVNTLDDFRKLGLVGGMGNNWFDAKIWEYNDLKYMEQSGNWKAIFRKIPEGHDYNYFSRGLNEILLESKMYPDLDIEKRLVLIYDRDFYFYLSKTGENAGRKYKDILNSSLREARKKGTMDKLIQKYWGSNFEELNYFNRTGIHLKLPVEKTIEVTILTDDSYKPFSFEENGKAKGMYIDVLRTAFSRMKGFNVKMKPVPWNRGKMMMERGQDFALAPAFYHGHNWSYLYPNSLPFYTETIIAVCAEEFLKSPRPVWPDDYMDLIIGNVAGFDGWGGAKFHALVKEGKIRYDETIGTERMIRRLGRKRMDCMMIEKRAFDYLFAKLKEEGSYDEGGKDVRLKKGAFIGIDPVSVGYSKTAMEWVKYPFQFDFMQSFDSEIYMMIKSGEIEKIMNAYED